MLEWCSISVSRTRSPRLRLARPQLYATRLIASLALRVQITSFGQHAPMKLDTFARAPSYWAVASSLNVWTPRWTLALVFS